MPKEDVMIMTTLDEIAARAEAAQGAWEDFQLGIATTRFALEEANNSAEDVKPMVAALKAVEAVAAPTGDDYTFDLGYAAALDKVHNTIREALGS